MAIIQGKIPPVKLPADYAARVIVRFKPEVKLPFSDAQAEHAKTHKEEWSALTKRFKDVELTHALEPLGIDDFTELERRLARVQRRGGQRPTNYYALTVPKSAEASAVAEMAARWPHVDHAYVECGPVPPPGVMPGDDPLSVYQGYLNAAPDGIDARWVWNNRNVDGIGAAIVDIEQGWLLDHEDLPKPNVVIVGGLNHANFGHGAAVLGMLVGVDNQVGVIGIAPNANARVCGQWFRFRRRLLISTGLAISRAMTKMSPGDVMTLETTAAWGPLFGFVPVETDEWEFNLIRAATDMGILVVQPTGNNFVLDAQGNPVLDANKLPIGKGTDLDAYLNANHEHVLNRLDAKFKDSGAVLCGAASPNAPHTRASFSGFGSRVDCYAWGWGVPACSDGWAGGVVPPATTPETSYTPNFGGSSSGTATTAGAALLLQSWHKKAYGSFYDPGTLRALLSDWNLNTQSVNGRNDGIGVMPNLRAIIQHEEARAIRSAIDRLYEVFLVLFGGVTVGGEGFGVLPDGTRVPIPPRGEFEALSQEKREVLLGLALTELAKLAGAGKVPESIDALGVSIVRAALEKIGKNQQMP